MNIYSKILKVTSSLRMLRIPSNAIAVILRKKKNNKKLTTILVTMTTISQDIMEDERDGYIIGFHIRSIKT